MKSKEHWVVEQSADMILVIANKVNVAVKNFTHLEDTSGLSVLAPKVFRNFRDSINTDAIEIEL